MDSDLFFERLAAETDATVDDRERLPARLKSRVYWTLVRQLAETGPLLSLSATRQDGRRLCVFETALSMVPGGERVGSMNPCRVCHAHHLAERMESAPIFWPHCPYAQFHRF